mgnify:CR=1 FL=1
MSLWISFKECFPLFLNGFILLYVLNEPKLIIERGLSEGVLQTGMQRDLNILFMPVFFMSLIILMVRPLITQLAFLYVDKEYEKFDSIIKKLFALYHRWWVTSSLFSLFTRSPSIRTSLWIRFSILSGTIYNFDFSWSFVAVAIIFENILTIMRKQHLLIAIYVAMFGCYFINY